MATTANRIRTAILGASGYTGGELLRLLVHHPSVELRALTADASTVAFVHQANIYLSATDRHDRSCLGVGASVQGGLRWTPATTNPSS